MNPLLGIAIKDVKTFLREKEALFWTIALPFLMMLLFTAFSEERHPLQPK
ncbi:MAG: hypothetical protein AOA65_0285 [Candidatus Bathyarchaeota archaeon BA1]|nr:MAG: hypothetical protein AOA65_0285 [Candidatus Bathyarchaeota archaeon BA1]